MRTMLFQVVAIWFATANAMGSIAGADEWAGEPESQAAVHPAVLVVVGAAGTDEYEQLFASWAERWRDAAARGATPFTAIGTTDPGNRTDRAELEHYLASRRSLSDEPLWLVLLGHGTFDGTTARFNLRGPDVTAQELASWLDPVERPLAVINCTSSSGPFLAALSGKRRVVITATRSGHEYNFARFGDYLSAALTAPQADLDKDEQVSLLEAFLAGAKGVQEFYVGEARLVTEHALLDDNGDKLGTPPDWFRGVRAVKSAKEGVAVDGAQAARLVLVPSRREEQLSAVARQRRDELETNLAALRQRKSQLDEESYLRLLEPLLLELARLYESSAP